MAEEEKIVAIDANRKRGQMELFQNDLRRLINAHSLENRSNTSDYDLAVYLMDCLQAYERVTRNRENRLRRK